MKKEKIRDEVDIRGSSILSDEIMEKIAEILDEELTADLERYAKMEVEIPPEHDRKILEMARRCDRERRRAKRRTACRKAARVAAVFLVVMLALGGIGISSSEAFRMRVFNLFENKEDGGVVLRSKTDAEILKGWEDYWYPEYLPEGYYLLSAEDDGVDKVMTFSNGGREDIRIFESVADSALAIDVDTNVYQRVVINAKSEAFLFEDANSGNSHITWGAGDEVLTVSACQYLDKDILIRIAENMKYVN